MIKIDEEAKRKIKYATDFDKLTERYVTENKYFTFSSPTMWILDKYLYHLLENSETKEFLSRWKYRPQYASFDSYGTTSMANILMYVNGCFCPEEFSFETILVPSFNSIIEMSQDRYIERTTDTINW